MQGSGHGFRRGALLRLTAASALFAPVPVSAATQPYVVTSFDSIRVMAPVRVVVTTGTGVSAKGEGDRAALDRILLDVSGNLLTVRMKPAQPGEKSAGPVTLALSTDAVRRASLMGGGTLSVDRMKGLRGEVALGGSGDIMVGAVALDSLSVNLAGSGRITLAGTAGETSIAVTGPGALMGEGLRAKQAKLSADGPGSATLTALVSAAVSSRGSGDVTVLGKAACTVKREGTGQIQCGGEAY